MTLNVVADVLGERVKQTEKWGVQRHPNVHPESKPGTAFDACFFSLLPSEEEIKKECEINRQDGELNWATIATEELVEAVSATTKEQMRAELVQAAAVIFAWIESLDASG
jgi:hypothetical protein